MHQLWQAVILKPLKLGECIGWVYMDSWTFCLNANDITSLKVVIYPLKSGECICNWRKMSSSKKINNNQSLLLRRHLDQVSTVMLRKLQIVNIKVLYVHNILLVNNAWCHETKRLFGIFVEKTTCSLCGFKKLNGQHFHVNDS